MKIITIESDSEETTAFLLKWLKNVVCQLKQLSIGY